MRLSTSLRRGIIETTVGGVLNKFIMRDRRLTSFFEDIFGEYVTQCEKYGYNRDIRKLAERWGELLFYQLVSAPIKKLPPTLIINRLGKKSWSNLGIVDDIHLDGKDEIINLTTKNESITRIIGKNDFMLGFFKGTINALYNSQSKVVDCLQSKESCEYQFKLEDEPIIIKGKEKSLYDRLNYLEPIKGFTFDDAIKKNTLQLKEDNKLYFREKRIALTENTIYHLVGNANLLLDKVPSISYDFFKKIIKGDSTDEQKLTLLKNLLQIMGWGIVRIVVKDKEEIIIEIRNPPYGLQLERDNWQFISRVILGYLWLLNEGWVISDLQDKYKNLSIRYLRE